MQEVTITAVRHKGSNAREWNVDLNGVPFGKIWTFKAKGEIHGYHAKPLNGEHTMHNSYNDAETAIRAAM